MYARLRIFLLALLLPGLTAANPVLDLPAMGSPSEALISQNLEAQIGASVLRQLRASGLLLEDPQINEYLQGLGQRLAVQAQDGGAFRFQFFVIRDPSINAFAFPGGYIAVNTGLLLATRNESELAGVLAHEIAHVTQRHISRFLQAQQQSSVTTVATLLAAIVLGGLAGPNAASAAIAVGQSLAIEQQLTHTRASELEADRIGIGILAAAGFDPEGTPRFFEVLQHNYGNAVQLPEFLRTHPVNADRIAEGLNRARQLDRPQTLHINSVGYELARARTRVLTASSPAVAVRWFEDEVAASPSRAQDLGLRYGLALAHLYAQAATRAQAEFLALMNERPEVMPFHVGLAQSYAALGQFERARQTYQTALLLSPKNRTVTLHYAETLLDGQQARDAYTVLVDLFTSVSATPPQIRFLAQTASAAGLTAEAHYYMAEYHISMGDASLAMNQLWAAVSQPGINDIQRGRYRARMDWLLSIVPADLRRQLEQEAGNPPVPLPMPTG